MILSLLKGCNVHPFWRYVRRVLPAPRVSTRAETQPFLAQGTPSDPAPVSSVAGFPDPIVVSLRDAIHSLLCSNMPTPGCPMYARVGSAHYDFYDMRAEILIEKLSPMIGRAYVQWLVVAVINELDLLCVMIPRSLVLLGLLSGSGRRMGSGR